MLRITPVVKHLILINLVLFVATFLISPNMGFDLKEIFSVYFVKSAEFRPYQFITSMFMHANFTHLLFNMMGLYFLGPYVEKFLGEKKFFILYMVAGLSGHLLSLGIDYFNYFQIIGEIPNQMFENIRENGRAILLGNENYSDPILGEMNLILNRSNLGASGAINGVMVAFAMLFPNVRLMLIFPPIPVKAKYLAIAFIAYDMFFGFSGSQTGIGHFAHLGGALAGILLIMYWKKPNFRL
jgi:membrane associated rhomboid family serine protease